MNTLESIAHFAIALPAAKNELEEQALTKAEAIELLWKLIGPEEQPQYVLDAISRLEQTEEFDLWLKFGEEWQRAMDYWESLEQGEKPKRS